MDTNEDILEMFEDENISFHEGSLALKDNEIDSLHTSFKRILYEIGDFETVHETVGF